MTTYYLVGSSGNWQGGTIWALTSGGTATAQTPTSADDVVFDLHSTGTVTVASGSNCHNLTMTAPGAATISMPTSLASLNIYGSMTLAAGITFSSSTTATINFLGTTTGLTVTHAGYLLPNMTYNGVGGEWTWQDNQTNLSANNIAISLINGSLITNNFSAGAANGISLLSNNSNVRSFNLGTTTWKLKTAGNGIIWDLGTITNLTFSGASSTITLGASTTFNGGGLVYGTVTDVLQAGGVDVLINGANHYTNLTLSNNGGTSNVNAYRLGADQIVSGTFTTNGATGLNARVYITSNVKGTARAISAGAVSASYADFQDIKGAGTASWNISAITGGSGDCGGNSGITFTQAANQYYQTSVSDNWNNAAKWFLGTNGGGGAGRIPLPQDTAIFDANSVTAAGKTITNLLYRLPKIDFTGMLNSPTVDFSAGAGDVSIFGDLTLISGMTLAMNKILTIEKRSVMLFNEAGQTWPGAITLDNANGSWPITANFALSGAFLLNSGTLPLSAQLIATTISLAGGATTDAGSLGQYKGTTFSCTGGSHTIRKLTISSTFAQSAGTIIIPVGGNGTWATSWTWTGITFVFTANGPITWSAGSYLVGANGGSGGSWLSC